MVFTVPPVKLSEKDLAWISEQLVEVDSLYMYFGLTLPEFTAVRRNNPYDYAGVKRNVLLSWWKKQGANATLANLVSALSEPDNVDVPLIQSIIQHFNITRKCVYVCTYNSSHSNKMITSHVPTAKAVGLLYTQ